MPTVPTAGEEFAKFIHHLTLCQEGAYMLAHLARAQGTSAKDRGLADGGQQLADRQFALARQPVPVGVVREGVHASLEHERIPVPVGGHQDGYRLAGALDLGGLAAHRLVQEVTERAPGLLASHLLHDRKSTTGLCVPYGLTF